MSRKPASLEAWLEVFLLERPKGVVWVPGSPSFFHFFGVIFRTLFGSKNANSPVKTACFAPWLGALNGLVFKVFCHFQDPLRIEKCKQSCKNCLFCSPARGPKKLFFFKVFWTSILAPCWFRLGPILAPSWPLLAPLGSSWPFLASSWLHFGSILASLGPSLRTQKFGAILGSGCP